MEYEQSKLKVSAKNNDYRTNNQGNVSFSLAGQSIISNWSFNVIENIYNQSLLLFKDKNFGLEL